MNQWKQLGYPTLQIGLVQNLVGEQRLVLIARVLTQQPKILLLDEPTSHLDLGNQIRLLRLINNLAKTGLSIIMSSHFPDHAFISSQKVALMKEGKLTGLAHPMKQ